MRSSFTDATTLREMLDTLTVDRLKPLAAFCVKPVPTRKGELIEAINTTFHSPRRLRELWDKLDTLSHQAVAVALAHNNRFDEEGFRAHHERTPWDTGEEKEKPWGYQRAVVPVDVFIYDQRIPADIAPLLQPLAPPVEKFDLPGSASLPPGPWLVAETEAAALHDLTATLSLIAEGKAASTPKTGRPTTATVTKLSERLLTGEFLPVDKKQPSPEPLRAFGWLILAQAARLVKTTASKFELTPKGQKMLAQPAIGHLQDILAKWRHANEFDELSRISALRGQNSRRTHLTRPAERKNAVLDALAQCPLGQWIEIEDFFRAVRAWQCNFEVQNDYYEYGMGGLYVGESWEYGYLTGYGHDTAWRATQAQYILVCLWEYLGTLGAVDVAYQHPEAAQFEIDYLSEIDGGLYFSPYVGLKYFRLNPLGAYLLGLADDYAGPAHSVGEPIFTVTANYEIAITRRPHFTPNVRLLLERLTESVSEGVYRLEREKILTALETGLTLTAITDFLSQNSTQPLPQTVRVWLDDLQRNSQALTEAGEALLFTAQDILVAQLLANDTHLRKFCLLGNETTLIVPRDKEAAFRRRVKQLGLGIRRP